MAANTEMSDWIKFFTAAGIPPGPATKYAMVFLDNRIQKSMLMDLTKEYLKEMGISIMGDVIAILKYAKTAHVKYENERPAITALQTKPDAKVEVKRQTTPGNRMLEHYMRKEGIMDGASPKVTVSPSMAVRLGAVPVGVAKNGTSDAAEVVPVKRPRKVKPEEEGKYIINMPKGSTPKTQKILEQKQVQQPQTAGIKEKSSPVDSKKSSVFARLGSGGSTTTAQASPAKAEASPVQSPGGSSIFSRLGGKRATDGSVGSALEYQGVLKSSSSDSVMKVPKATVVKVAQPTTVKVTLGGAKMVSESPKESLQMRLGKATATASPVGASVVRAKSLQMRIGTPVTKASTSSPSLVSRVQPKVTVTIGGKKKTGGLPGQSVMDRLGVQRPEVSTTTSTTSHMDQVGVKSKVQDRLGGGVEASASTSGSGKGTVQLNKGPAGVKRSMQARLGAPSQPAQSPSALRVASALRAAGAQKPASMKQTVTVTLGAKPSSMQGRLGMPSLAADKMRSDVGSQSASGPKILKRIGSPMAAAVPTKQSKIKERLGVMRAEATSTTPIVTVTLDGGKTKQKMAAAGGIKSPKNVFSRLGGV